MKRSLSGAIAMLALVAAAPALAADYPMFGEMRPSYDDGWEQSSENPLRMEAGLRYWYSVGEQKSDIGGRSYNTNDRSHILEGHFRIDDDYTSTFVKGQAGYAVYTTGDHNTAVGVPSSFEGGQIGYAGADFGYTPFGNETFRLGALVGYQYNRESPDRNRYDVQHADGLNLHSLRLGVTARADINEMFDIDAEIAAIPYAYGYGASAETPMANTVIQGVTVNRTITETSGALFGASGQVMLGFHPTENLTIRVGGRAWLLNGPSSSRQKWWNTANPNSFLYSDQPLNGFSLLRYGALVELTGRF